MDNTSLTPIAASAWSLAHAQHLLNRAGFGVPRERLAALTGSTPEAAVTALVDYTPATPAAPDFLVSPERAREVRELRKTVSTEESRRLQNDLMNEERAAITALQAWWFQRMRSSASPLEEKMTLFWHGHFAVSASKVRSSFSNHQLNQIFRMHATGNFKALTIAVGQSPAMLYYLDNRRSTRAKPNENWARELMELFTLGQGQYTERDIKESARAFTGWTSDYYDFDYRIESHDPGEKTFLGRTGAWDGWDIVNIIFEQPACAEFIAAKLWRYFASETPHPDVVAGLAQTLRENNFELRPVLQQMFLSEAFYSAAAMGAQIKSPAQFLVQLASDLGMDDVPDTALAKASGALGQRLFHPPNVKGWDGNRAWINANALLLRYNMPEQLVRAQREGARKQSREMMAQTMLEQSDADSAAEAREARQAAIRAKLQSLPRDERRAAGLVLREGTPEERRALLTSWGIDAPGAAGSDPATLFEQFTFANAGECVDALARRYLSVPLHAEQRRELALALGVVSEDAPLRAADISPEQRRDSLRLLFSLAEYQLC